MRRFRWLGSLLATVVLAATPMQTMADSVVMYDEGSGIPLQELLAEDAAVWPVMAAPSGDGLSVKAKGAVLMDQASGRVLFEQDPYAQVPIASVTKVMTLLLVMEAIDDGRLAWEEAVVCSDRAASMGGSQIWLEPGEIMTVEELVKAAAVVSANDACTALAEHISGTLEAFVAAMNARVAELGLRNTRFVDCSGLDDTGYSCAYDVAVMSRELMRHKRICDFTTIWMDTLRGGASQLVNTNKLVRHYKGATGLKTGTTGAAGYCLAATAQREDTAFVAVVLGSPTTNDRFDGARALLDHAFAAYESYTPDAKSLAVPPIPVLKGQAPTVAVQTDAPATVLLAKGQKARVESSMEVAQDLQAPVEKGQVVGTWRLTVDGETVGEYPLRTACAVPAKTFRYAYTLLADALLG